MSNAELIAGARDIADSVEGWLNSLPPYERDSSDRDFDRRTLASLRAMTDALESADGANQQLRIVNRSLEQQLAAAQSVIAECGRLAGQIMFDRDAEPARTAILDITRHVGTDAMQAVKAAAWDGGAKWAAVECGAIRDERNGWIAPGDNPYRAVSSTPEQPEGGTR